MGVGSGPAGRDHTPAGRGILSLKAASSLGAGKGCCGVEGARLLGASGMPLPSSFTNPQASCPITKPQRTEEGGITLW